MGQVLPWELGPSAQMSHEAQQGEQKGGKERGRKEEGAASFGSAPSSVLSSPGTPSSPTRTWSAASLSSPMMAPSARRCPWTVRLMSGTTSQCWPQSLVRSPWAPGMPRKRQQPPSRGAVLSKGVRKGEYWHRTLISVLGPQFG